MWIWAIVSFRANTMEPLLVFRFMLAALISHSILFDHEIYATSPEHSHVFSFGYQRRRCRCPCAKACLALNIGIFIKTHSFHLRLELTGNNFVYFNCSDGEAKDAEMTETQVEKMVDELLEFASIEMKNSIYTDAIEHWQHLSSKNMCALCVFVQELPAMEV